MIAAAAARLPPGQSINWTLDRAMNPEPNAGLRIANEKSGS